MYFIKDILNLEETPYVNQVTLNSLQKQWKCADEPGEGIWANNQSYNWGHIVTMMIHNSSFL